MQSFHTNINDPIPIFIKDLLIVLNDILFAVLIMKNTNLILADLCTEISELKKNPLAVIDNSKGKPVAILNRNQPVFYAVPASTWEDLLEEIEDMTLMLEREGETEIEVDFNAI